jgi:hypothetical protein
MPKIMDRLVSQLKKKGKSEKAAYAIATASLQKSGSFKKGSNKLTRKGKKRQSMTAAARAKNRAATRAGKSTRKYKYNSKTNQAKLK